jgi:hypothetical protein
MATQSIAAVSPSYQASKASWSRLPNESAKAFAGYVAFAALGPDRTYAKVAAKLGKSEQLMARWGKRHNWHNRALDFDEHNEGELQRRLLLRRARARERALAAAEMLDEKVTEAIKALEVTRVVKTEGQPDKIELLVSVTEIANMLKTSRDIQDAILGDGKEDRVAAIYVNFGSANPKYAFEQPAAMQEARRKAAEEQRQRELETM